MVSIQATSENEQTVTRLASDVWSNGDFDVLSEIVASDIEAHLPGVPEVRNREEQDAYAITLEEFEQFNASEATEGGSDDDGEDDSEDGSSAK